MILSDKLLKVFPIIIEDYEKAIQDVKEMSDNQARSFIARKRMENGICDYANRSLNQFIYNHVKEIDHCITYWGITAYQYWNSCNFKEKAIDALQLRVDKMKEYLTKHNDHETV